MCNSLEEDVWLTCPCTETDNIFPLEGISLMVINVRAIKKGTWTTVMKLRTSFKYVLSSGYPISCTTRYEDMDDDRSCSRLWSQFECGPHAKHKSELMEQYMLHNMRWFKRGICCHVIYIRSSVFFTQA